MPVNELNSLQLEHIRRLLIDPLREAVKAEVELGHARLHQAVEQLALQVATHAKTSDRRADEAARRLTVVEAETVRFGAFRSRVLVVYGFVAALLSVVWSILRDRLVNRLGNRGP